MTTYSGMDGMPSKNWSTPQCPLDPTAWAALATTTEAVQRLLNHPPFQAALVFGDIGVQEAVHAVVHKYIGKKAITAAARAFVEQAKRKAKKPRTDLDLSEDWLKDLQRNDKDMPLSNDYNALLVFANNPKWKGVIGYNRFAERYEWLMEPPFNIAANQTFPFSRVSS